MCTAITFTAGSHYFGRNLDLEYSYNETVTVTPRNYPFHFRRMGTVAQHYALIGMAYVQDEYPLYYDAVNEHGLAMAGLNFPGNAVYFPEAAGKDNVTPFEFIPWVLGQCRTIADVRALLSRMNLLNEPYSAQLPLSPLHWIIADKDAAIVVENVADGMKIYDDPMGVLTNNPPFDFMQQYVTTYRDLSPEPSVNRIAGEVDLPVYCQGLAARGLPGDWSSASRFVRAAFVKLNAMCGTTETEAVHQFFHMLTAVAMPKGCVRLGRGVTDMTVYTACCDQDRGVYYYTTYDNRQITAIDMQRTDLDGTALTSWPLRRGSGIVYEN